MSIKRWIILSLAVYSVICVILYFYATAAITSVFFRLLNFAIMVAIIAFIFYRKLYPTTKEMIHQKELEKKALAIRYDELVDRQKQFEKGLENQDYECRYLLTKIDQWRAKFNEMQAQNEREREEAHLRAQKKAQVQSEWLGRNMAYKKIIECTVDIMRKDLIKRFSDVDQQKKFINRLENFMRETTS